MVPMSSISERSDENSMLRIESRADEYGHDVETEIALVEYIERVDSWYSSYLFDVRISKGQHIHNRRLPNRRFRRCLIATASRKFHAKSGRPVANCSVVIAAAKRARCCCWWSSAHVRLHVRCLGYATSISRRQ